MCISRRAPATTRRDSEITWIERAHQLANFVRSHEALPYVTRCKQYLADLCGVRCAYN
jgi:hypothetical protein